MIRADAHQLASTRRALTLTAVTLALLCGLILLAGRAGICLVLSDSMAPTLRSGDVLFLRPLMASAVQPGMIVSYQWDGKLITHRVVSLENGSMETRGDNNLQSDPWVASLTSVTGTPILVIPYLGYLLLWMRTLLGWSLMVLLPATLLLILLTRNLARLIRLEQLPAALRHSLVVRRIPPGRRWLHRARRRGYHILARVRRGLILPGVALLLIAWPLLMVNHDAWAYFNSVTRIGSRFSVGALQLGAQLTGLQTLTSDRPGEMRSASSTPAIVAQICVENTGKHATEKLEILAILQTAAADGTFHEVQRLAVDLSTAPQVKAGEKHCYAYTLQGVQDAVSTYRVVAEVTVTNLEGWVVGSAGCPGTNPCRKGLTLTTDLQIAQPTPTATATPTATSTLPATQDPLLPSVEPTITETLAPTPTPTLTPSETEISPLPTAEPTLAPTELPTTPPPTPEPPTPEPPAPEPPTPEPPPPEPTQTP